MAAGRVCRGDDSSHHGRHRDGDQTVSFAVATPVEKLVLSLPKRVRLHLSLGRRDIVAWVAREGGPKGGQVYLVRSAFPDLIPVAAS